MIPLFLESSAVLAVIKHEERRDEALIRIHSAGHLVASRLLHVECTRAIHRYASAPPSYNRAADARREFAELIAKVHLMDISRTICDEAGRIHPGASLRTLDAIHVATYLKLKQSVADLEMLSFDARICDALGLS